MEADSWRDRFSVNRLPSYEKQSVLILDENAAPCKAGKCDSLFTLLQGALPGKSVQQHRAKKFHFPDKVAVVPDLIVVRPAIGESTQELIQSCKEKTRASILALLCAKWDRPFEELPPVLTKVDDFLSCPFHESELVLRVTRLLRSSRTTIVSENPHGNEPLHFGALVGQSESFVRAVKNIPPLAQSDATVLICGETGTGKELFARAIHYHSTRRNKPFIPVNCAALPDHLFENELFGHVKGAFTDARTSEKGLIAEAEGGSLILDEVDTLSPVAQAKLLRFLQDGEYRPLGSSRSVSANVRVIAATNTDLFERVKAKIFRDDLYFRLDALSVIIPPLRERVEDIVHLSNHFLAQYAKGHNTMRRGISSEALCKLMAYEWPGNVRELEGLILRALVLTASTTLQPEDINLPQQTLKPTQENARLSQAKTSVIQNFELNYLTNLLSAYHGNITHAAKAAGKQRSTLQRLLRKYSLNPNSFRL